jgi:peptide/nickel transport system substrate-binding protein
MNKKAGFSRLLRYGALAVAGILLLVILACGDDDTPTPRPTATSPPDATATPQPTATPRPTATTVVALPVGKQGGILNQAAVFGAPHWSSLQEGGPISASMDPFSNLLIEYGLNQDTDDQLEIRGDIADSWTLGANGTTYTFFLNENARWHDGVPITAADIKFTLDKMVEEGVARPWAGLIKPFYESSQVVDNSTIQVETKFPAPAFLPILGHNYMIMLPKHQFEGMSEDDMKLQENILGSGPFKMTDFEQGVKWVYERNADYWKEGRPYLDGVSVFLIPGGGQTIAAYKAGQVLMSRDPVSGMSNTEALDIAEDLKDRARVLWGGPMSQITVQPNLAVDPFTDKKVRQAIHLAVHRQPFIETLTLGKGTLGYPFPPGFWFSIPEAEVAQLPGFRELDGEKHPDDIAEAKRLMADAGFPNGFSKEMMVVNLFGVTEMGQIAADQLRRTLNIELTLDIVDIATLIPRRGAADFEITAYSDGTTMIDPEDALGRVYRDGGSANYANWLHPRIEVLYDLQARELDQDIRAQYAQEAAQIVLDEAPVIGLYWADRAMFLYNSIKNFHMPDVWYTLNFKYENIWCDPVCQ